MTRKKSFFWSFFKSLQKVDDTRKEGDRGTDTQRNRDRRRRRKLFWYDFFSDVNFFGFFSCFVLLNSFPKRSLMCLNEKERKEKQQKKKQKLQINKQRKTNNSKKRKKSMISLLNLFLFGMMNLRFSITCVASETMHRLITIVIATSTTRPIEESTVISSPAGP